MLFEKGQFKIGLTAFLNENFLLISNPLRLETIRRNIPTFSVWIDIHILCYTVYQLPLELNYVPLELILQSWNFIFIPFSNYFSRGSRFLWVYRLTFIAVSATFKFTYNNFVGTQLFYTSANFSIIFFKIRQMPLVHPYSLQQIDDNYLNTK